MTTHASASPNPAAAANKRDFRPGQYLFHEGEPSHCMYLIKKGTVSIRKSKADAYVEIARLYSNEVLGELSFFDRHPRSAAAIALTDVEVLEIRFDALDKVYHQVPDYLKAIMGCVADRLRKANDTIRRLQKNVVKEAASGQFSANEDPGDSENEPETDEASESDIPDEGQADSLFANASIDVGDEADLKSAEAALDEFEKIPNDIPATSPPDRKPPRR